MAYRDEAEAIRSRIAILQERYAELREAQDEADRSFLRSDNARFAVSLFGIENGTTSEAHCSAGSD